MLPYLSGKDVKRIDERTGEEFGVSILQLMEVAGTRMAEFCRAQSDDLQEESFLIVCGKGNNGGDGLVMARILNNWGAQVSIHLAFSREEHQGVVLQNLESCEKLGIRFVDSVEAVSPSIIVDCLFGFSFYGELRPEHLALVEYMSKSEAKVFSCDLPSGMNSEHFEGETTVQADCTLTFTVPKQVLESSDAQKRCGDLYLLDIGIVKPLYEEMGVKEPLFQERSWMRL